MGKRKMAVAFFTLGGRRLAERMVSLVSGVCEKEMCWELELYEKPSPLDEWCREQFECRDALVFIGAMGIAVRAVAPFLESKATDPAVLVLDEKGTYVIPVLSGHLGGANELARQLSRLLDAQPVITTSSDVNGKLAVDVFAKNNHLAILNMEQAKEAAAAIVAGEKVLFSCDGRICGAVPKELTLFPSGNRAELLEKGEGERCREFLIRVSPKERFGSSRILQLVPKAYVLGIGCKAGKTMAEIESFVKEQLSEKGIFLESIASVASIDLKEKEEGLLSFCRKYQLPFFCYTASQLREAPGEYASSEFVKQVAGVGNVCERAAMRRVREEFPQAKKEDHLAMEKRQGGGITMALARRDWSVSFE